MTTGATLGEVLVVIAIIGILACLLFPAVQFAREGARRTQCQSHLRQCGLSIHQYETIHTAFPPSKTYGSVSRSAIPLLLPHLDADATAYDLGQAWSTLENRRAVRRSIAVLLCPSVPSRDRTESSIVFGPAVGDFAPVHGVDAAYCHQMGWPAFEPPNHNGVFTREGCPMADITDGLSQTALLVEDAGRPQSWRSRLAAGGISPHGAWANPEYEIGIGGSDGSGHGGGPCLINCTNDNETYSFHPGGANVVFSDANVRFIHEQIDPRVYAAMITRRAGDKVDFGAN